MRLIDADRLKQHYAWLGEAELRRIFDTIVDLQPTIEPKGGDEENAGEMQTEYYKGNRQEDQIR